MAKKKNGNETKALTRVGSQEYAILKAGAKNLPQILRTNMGDDGLSPFDLDRIKIPAGGAQSWEIPGLSGDTKSVKEFCGVIIFHKTGRVYWKEDFTGGGVPPNCSADNGATGQGEPGGECAICPFAAFGSDERGRGQACKQVKQLFVMRNTGLLPILIALPPTSLKSARQYLLRLASHSLPFYTVETRFSLQKAKSADGFDYSQAVLSLGEKLSESQIQAFQALVKCLGPRLQSVAVSEDDLPTE